MSDFISRQAAIEALYEALHTEFKGTFTDSMSLAIEMGNNIPSAEPNIETLTPEEVVGEISPVSLYPAYEWYKVVGLLYEMGYVICRKENR